MCIERCRSRERGRRRERERERPNKTPTYRYICGVWERGTRGETEIQREREGERERERWKELEDNDTERLLESDRARTGESGIYVIIYIYRYDKHPNQVEGDGTT